MLWELFITFFKIGLFTFGGGYAMIPLIEQEVTVAHGWMDTEALRNLIAVAESTPGPVAINMATFVGSTQAGILGSMCATLGVVLPSFIIILLIATIAKNFINNKWVQGALSCVRPLVIALIVSTGLVFVVSSIWTNYPYIENVSVSIQNLAITLICAGIYIGIPLLTKKKMSPILLILISAILGMLIF